MKLDFTVYTVTCPLLFVGLMYLCSDYGPPLSVFWKCVEFLEVIIMWGYSSGWFDVCQSYRCGKAYYSSCSINQCCYCRWAMHHVFSYSANYSGELSQLTKYVARETYFIAFIWHTFIRTYFSPVYTQAVCMKKIHCNVPDQILDTDWLMYSALIAERLSVRLIIVQAWRALVGS